MTFQEQIQQGIPNELPSIKPYDSQINHAPKRKEILTEEEKKSVIKKIVISIVLLIIVIIIGILL